LDFSKIEAGDFKTSFGVFRVRDLFEKLKKIFEPMALQKKLFFNLTIDETVPDSIY